MRIARSLMVVGVVFALAVPVLAQQGTADMRGHVLDSQGQAVPGVTLLLKHQQTGMYRQTVSDKDGVYVFSGVTPGMWELTAELSGFRTVRRRDIRLEVGRTSTVDVTMAVSTVSEEITVTAAAPIVDVTSKEVGGNITSRELVELPTINRNFIGFVGLLPGVVPNISTESFGSDSVSVYGQDSRNNNYMVDGGNNNDDVIGQRAGTQARTPIEAIQEFQVLTGQYDAEFGRTTGAIVNALTKQGTNDFKGSAFAFLQDASFTEKDYFAKQLNRPKPDTKFFQYGATLGGPIIHDRLHFFLSLERPEVDRGTTINIPARPEFNTTTTTQDRVWNTMLRIDGQLNASNNGAIRWLREESPQSNQIIPVNTLIGNGFPVTLAASREEVDVDQTAVAHWNTVVDTSKFNTARLVWTQENVAFGNPNFNGNGRRQDLLEPTLVYLTFVDQQSDVAQSRMNNAYYIEDTFNWYVNKHDLRMGVQLARLTNHAVTQDNLNGTFVFRTNGPFNPGDFRTYPERLQIRVPGASDINMAVKYYGVFLQDKWSFRDNMTLSLGARYDLERLPVDESDNPLFDDPDDYPVDSNNISPRLGITYNLGATRPTILRGGVGRFYDKTHLELITAVMTQGVFSSSFIRTFPQNAADPGPSRGERPTDPFLANGPFVDRALLAQQFPPGTRIKNTGTVVLDSPDRVIPYTDQISVGVEHQITPSMSASFDYVHGEGRDQFMSYERNPGLRVDTTRTGRVNRIDSNFNGSVLERVNEGRIKYDSYQFQVDHHLGSTYQYRIAYTYSKTKGNTSGNGIPVSNFQLLEDMNLDLNEGPTDFDRPHNLVFSGSWRVPHTGGLTLATITRYVSGDPFTIQDQNSDPDRNGILFDPLPAGKYSGNGANSFSVFNKGGRNGARGPDFFQMDMRLGYRIPFGLTTTELFAELFNVTNRVNYATPSGDRRNPNFLVLTTTRAGTVPRTGQFGIRMTF